MSDETQTQKLGMTVAYRLGDALYLNITNRCANACRFCIRQSPAGVGYDLWLEHEPTVAEIMAAVGDLAAYREVVFCGYGEPLERPEVVIEVARQIKADRLLPIRINTNGLADLTLGRDILPELQGLIDVISISLNGSDPQSYQEVSQSRFGLAAYPAVCAFAQRSKSYIPRVILSVVRYPGVDVDAAARVAAGIGAAFRVREMQG